MGILSGTDLSIVSRRGMMFPRFVAAYVRSKIDHFDQTSERRLRGEACG